MHMEWITGIQKAIDYIEDHLTESIDYEAVAKESFSSSYHFQRVFSILSGYTLGEYIRNRRLSLAGAELATGKEKIIANTQGLCTEMEGAAIAQTAYRNKVPFVILRAISDKADDSAEMDYPTFEAIAAQRCAAVTRALAKQLKI